MTSDLSQRDPVEVLGEEFLARRRRGEDPDINDYIAQHPEFADQISELFPAMIAMERLKATKNDTADERPIQLRVDRLERLGDYRIIREIGHGGMGIVYEAEQQSLHRRVAVKVFPKQAIGDSKQLKRFQREAETAGGLHHTNIVPVFGVGQQDGLHYFVMQYLEGVSLDQLIHGLIDLPDDFVCENYLQHVFDKVLEQRRAARDASTTGRAPGDSETDAGHPQVFDLRESDVVEKETRRRRARSFGRQHWRRIAEIGIQVADALQYAHSKGVMHRDIKPSNLILGLDSLVWVTDFGLAVTPDQERLSRSGDVVGTLRYMSPEHLNGHADHRSDVYSLGLTLYELLTMQPAFEGENRGSLIRKVARSSPPAPRSICPAIPRDLETVLLKAIARSPESRYRTAGEFADDLRRFCDDQPIRARRIGYIERLGRWSRRNPAMAGMTAALILGALTSLAAVSWNWRQAVIEKQNAQTAEQRAENNLTLALGSMDRLLERFESDWMSHPVAAESGESAPQLRFVVSDHSAAILEEALGFYDEFAQQNANSPKLQRDTAKAYRRAGDILNRLGRFADAEQAYRRSADALLGQVNERENEPALIAETAAVINRLALVLHNDYQSEKAKEQLEFARQMLSDHLKRTESGECTYELALTNSNLGLVLWRLHRGEESTQRHQRAIWLLDALVERNPDVAKYRLSLASAYRNYYPIAAACKERSHADEIRQSSERLLDELVADFPDVPDYRCELSEMLTIAAQDSSAGLDRRRIQVRRAVQLAGSLTRDFRSIPRYQMALAQALNQQANLQRRSSPQRARGDHERATEMLRELCERFPAVPSYRAFTAKALKDQAVTLRAMEQLEEAICVFEESIALQADYLEELPGAMFARKQMAGYLSDLATTLDEVGDHDRASEVRRHARSYWNRRPVEES